MPRPGKRHAVSGWRYIRGTSKDTGIDRVGGDNWNQSLLARSPDVTVLQKRNGRYYVYNPVRKRWVKGYRSAIRTLRNVYVPPHRIINFGTTGWRTASIRGLTRGELFVVADCADSNFYRAPTRTRTVMLTRG